MRNTVISILLVDDSRAALDFIADELINLFSTLKISITVDRFEGFKEFLKKRKPTYDVCITDWNLPDGKGSDVASALEGPTYKAILTGMTDDNIEIARYCVENSITYIPKSAPLDVVFKFIKMSLRRGTNCGRSSRT